MDSTLKRRKKRAFLRRFNMESTWCVCREDTHKENTSSNKTEGLKHKYVYLGNWYVQVFIRDSYTQTKSSKK